MERASARDLVVGAEANRLLSTDSSMAAPCRRGISMSFRVCQSGRAEEEAMTDTVSIEGGGERPSNQGCQAEREEPEYAAGA